MLLRVRIQKDDVAVYTERQFVNRRQHNTNSKCTVTEITHNSFISVTVDAL